MNDLTIIYYTANHIPDKFAEKIRQQLLKAANGIPIISISYKPIDFGHNICVGNIGRSTFNLFQQPLRGAKIATTKYVAMAEDDVLYAPENFSEFVPEEDVFSYNTNKWDIFTWDKQPLLMANHSPRMTTLIAPRDLLIENLEEKYAKYPTPESMPRGFGEPGRYEAPLGVTVRKIKTWRSSVPNVIFFHPAALGTESWLGMKKKHGEERYPEHPLWGTPEQIAKLYE